METLYDIEMKFEPNDTPTAIISRDIFHAGAVAALNLIKRYIEEHCSDCCMVKEAMLNYIVKEGGLK